MVRISISALVVVVVVVVLVCQSTVLLSHVTCCNSTSQAKYGANFLAPHPPLPLYSSPPLSVGQGKLMWLVWQLTEFDPVTMSRCWHHVYKPCDHIGHGMWPVRHVGRPPNRQSRDTDRWYRPVPPVQQQQQPMRASMGKQTNMENARLSPSRQTTCHQNLNLKRCFFAFIFCQYTTYNTKGKSVWWKFLAAEL